MCKKIFGLGIFLSFAASLAQAVDLTVKCALEDATPVASAQVYVIGISSFSPTQMGQGFVPIGAPDPSKSYVGVSNALGLATFTSLSAEVEYAYSCSKSGFGGKKEMESHLGIVAPDLFASARARLPQDSTKTVTLQSISASEYIPLNLTFSNLTLPGGVNFPQNLFCHVQYDFEPGGDAVVQATAAITSGIQIHNLKRPNTGESYTITANVDCFSPVVGRGTRSSVSLSSSSLAVAATMDFNQQFVQTGVETAAKMENRMEGNLGEDAVCFTIGATFTPGATTYLSGFDYNAEVEVRNSTNTYGSFDFTGGDGGATFQWRGHADSNGRVCVSKAPEFQFQAAAPPPGGMMALSSLYPAGVFDQGFSTCTFGGANFGGCPIKESSQLVCHPPQPELPVYPNAYCTKSCVTNTDCPPNMGNLRFECADLGPSGKMCEARFTEESVALTQQMPPPAQAGGFGLLRGGTYFYMASADSVASSGPVQFVYNGQKLNYELFLSTSLPGRIRAQAKINSAGGQDFPLYGASIMIRPQFGAACGPVCGGPGDGGICKQAKSHRFIQTTTGYAEVPVAPGIYALEVMHPEILPMPWNLDRGADQSRDSIADNRCIFVSTGGAVQQFQGYVQGDQVAQGNQNPQQIGADNSVIDAVIKFATSTNGLISGTLTFPQAVDLTINPLMIVAVSRGQVMGNEFRPEDFNFGQTKMGFTRVDWNLTSGTTGYTIAVSSGAGYELFFKGAAGWGLVFREGFFRPHADLRNSSSTVQNFAFGRAGALKASVYKPDGSKLTPNLGGSTGGGAGQEQFFGAFCEVHGEDSPGWGGTELGSDGSCRIENLLPGNYTFRLMCHGPGCKYGPTEMRGLRVKAGESNSFDVNLKKAVELVVGCSTATMPSGINFSAQGLSLLIRALPAGTPLTLDIIEKWGGFGGMNFDFENELATATVTQGWPQTTACKPKFNIPRWNVGPHDFYLLLKQDMMAMDIMAEKFGPPPPGEGGFAGPTFTGKAFISIVGTKKDIYVDEKAGTVCTYNPPFAPPPPPCPPGQNCPPPGQRQCVEIPFDSGLTSSFTGTCAGNKIFTSDDCQRFSKDFDKLIEYVPFGAFQDSQGNFKGMTMCVPNVVKSSDVFNLEMRIRHGLCEDRDVNMDGSIADSGTDMDGNGRVDPYEMRPEIGFLTKMRTLGMKLAIENLPAFTGRVVFDTPNYPPVSKEVIASGAKTLNVDLDAEAGNGATLLGVVKDTATANIQDAVVQVFSAFDDDKMLTTSSGAYSFAGLTPGKQKIKVIKPGYAIQEKVLNLVNNSTTTANFNLELAPGGVIGSIYSQLYPQKVAVAGVKVTLLDETRLAEIASGTVQNAGIPRIEVLTGPDGSYNLDGLPPGHVFRTVVKAEGRVTTSTNVTVGVTTTTRVADILIVPRPPLPENFKMLKSTDGSISFKIDSPVKLAALPQVLYKTGTCPMNETGATSLATDISTRSATSFTLTVSAARAAQESCLRWKMNSGRRTEHMDVPIDPKLTARGTEDLEDILADGATVKPENSNTGLEVEPMDLTRLTSGSAGAVAVGEESKTSHTLNSDGKCQSDIVKIDIDSATITSGQSVDLSIEVDSKSVLDSVASGAAALYQHTGGEWKEVKGSTLSVNTMENSVTGSLNSVANAYLQHLGMRTLESLSTSGLAVYQTGKGYVPMQGAGSQEGTFAIRTKSAGGVGATKYVQYNFPNPFNLKSKAVTLRTGTTGIGATITGTYIVVAPTGSGTSSVTIRIFNLAGDLVRSISGTATNSQYNYFEWNGKNDSGSDVASGVYFAVVDAPGAPKKEPIKMVVVK